MKPDPRQQDILKMLNEHGFVTTEDLAKHFNLTTQTMRRDINILCEMGLAKRKHGGVALPPAMQNQNFSARASFNESVKKKIGEIAAQYIEPESTLFLGYGSTVIGLAQSLPRQIALTVVTNNLNAALILSGYPNIETWLTGGKIRNQHKDMTGFTATELLRSFRADLAVCSIAGISETGELHEFQYEEAEITRLILKNSKKTFLLADSSKYLRSATVSFAHMKDIDTLFTDCEDSTLADLCKQSDTHLILTEEHS
ncbi:DeoR/GlpR family DNA-binding transcription regulator [Vibrio nigripulchritudo]|uniref:DeoR/GlpR family DNA-binding transcription regulator n=1 Tax=Vibrio nigripulchritudo TaxID=28173 RepID=UPI00030A9108|nr:DeoR/GlpR family DNA-binding transcription regulator [Vibrio nigripulchritudo]